MLFDQPMTVFDQETQQTATADAKGTDIGFGPVLTETPYTTYVSNPMFMSLLFPQFRYTKNKAVFYFTITSNTNTFYHTA